MDSLWSCRRDPGWWRLVDSSFEACAKIPSKDWNELCQGRDNIQLSFRLLSTGYVRVGDWVRLPSGEHACVRRISQNTATVSAARALDGAFIHANLASIYVSHRRT